MEIERELASIAPQGETILTIGMFDGVHAGHRYLLKKMQQRAAEKNLLSGVVTFSPHPQSVLHPHKQLPYLSNLEDRVRAFRELGINIVTVLTFTPKVARLSAQEFVSLVKKQLRMRSIIVGPDFALVEENRSIASCQLAIGSLPPGVGVLSAGLTMFSDTA